MKIGIYDPYLDDLGGGEKYMMTLAACLSEKHDVFVFWDNADDIKAIEKRFSLDLSKIKRRKNIFTSKVSFLQRLKASKQFDSIIILSDGSIPFLLSGKLFVHIQQPLQLKHLDRKTKLKLTRVNAIFYNSEFTQSYNKRLFRKIPNLVLYPPVSLSPKNRKKENIILHVGRYRPMNIANKDFKKQHVMIDTFKQMIDEGLKNWKFVVATSIHDTNDSDFTNLLESAKGYPIEFVINKPNAVIWDLYNKAKIYWHASGYGEDLKKHPEYAEHFGISTVEAMGAGCVPVVINAGGQPEIVTHEENGFLWETLEQQKKFTNKVIADENLYTKLAEAAKKRAEDFSLERFKKQVFEKLVSIS